MTQFRWLYQITAVISVASAGVPGLAQRPVPPSPTTMQPSTPMQENLIGTVSLQDATVTGAVSTSNDRATLVWNGTVVAKDHVAYVELARGGNVRVCATSGLHLTAGTPASPDASNLKGVVPDPVATPVPLAVPTIARPPAPLMLSLDRGALELRMQAISSDLLMTPDLRIGFSEAGALDLRVRVTRNGDTCVENRVAGLSEHPTLHVASMFGDDTYNVLPGQHVLFERGSLREVVDNESSPCGCPEKPAIPPVVEAGSLSLKPGEKLSSTQAEAQHPFPAAVSQGLAPPPEVPQAPPGVVHTQVATTLSYSSAEADREVKNEAAAQPATVTPAMQPPATKKGGFFHAVGRFFKKVF